MIKESKRKTFKFYRSYFDVFNELENDKDKLLFVKSLLDKQFLDIDPKLKGIVKFAYISQLHSIEKQVKGWKDATGEDLTGVYQPPGGSPLGSPPLEEEEKEQVKEEEKGIDVESIDFDQLLLLINTVGKRNFKVINKTARNKYNARLKEGYTKDIIRQAIINAYDSDFHKESDFKHLTPSFFCRPDKLDSWGQMEVKPINNNPVVTHKDFWS